jgi:hypothetical protein
MPSATEQPAPRPGLLRRLLGGRRSRRAEPPAPPGPDAEQSAGALGRGVRILLGLAAAVVVSFGMAAIGNILAPALLALVLTICAQPVRVWLERHGTPQGLATGAVGLTLFALLDMFMSMLSMKPAHYY